MTEDQWLGGAMPFPLLQHAWNRLSDRRKRLLACAGCRLIAPLLKDPRTTAALDVAERFAEGTATPEELEAAHKDAVRAQNAQKKKALLFAYAAVMDASAPWRSNALGLGLTSGALTHAVQAKVLDKEPRLGYGHLDRDRPAAFLPMADLVREVAGNPFLRVTFAAAWSSDATVKLARKMYETRDFAKMPRLADTLAKAGCSAADILAHCREPGPHVRGCWVVDLVLGKK